MYVRTADGERSVGQVPGVPAEEAMAFFTRRYEALELEVSLLERRVASGALSPDDAAGSVKTVRTAVDGAHAVGDLDGLLARLDALAPRLAEQRAVRRAERAKQNEEARAAKEKFVVEAEKLAAGNDWRGGVNRFRALLDQWKTLPRLDRATDDALWHRFSSARTTYTRRRKAQFAQQNEQRESARTVKEQLVVEAEALADSTDWGPTTGTYRDLMTRWKAAGPAPRGVDEALWQRSAPPRTPSSPPRRGRLSEQDAEFRVQRRGQGGAAGRGRDAAADHRPGAGQGALTATCSSAGPRSARCRATPSARWRTGCAPSRTAIKNAEDERWRRTNPEARARAEDTAAKLEAQIATLLEQGRAKAEARGDTKAAADARSSAATYREWLEQARKAVADYSA